MADDPFENFKKSQNDKDKMERKIFPKDNVGKVSNYFAVPDEIKELSSSQSSNANEKKPSSVSAVKRLEALIQLLVRKGVVTEEELKAMLTLLGE